MAIATTMLVLVLAFILEAAFGYPAWAYERIGHPVTWIGALIGMLDGKLNDEGESTFARRASGVVALVIILVVSVSAGQIVERVLAPHWIGLAALAVVVSTLIASRSLYEHVHEVAGALRTDGLEAARRAVGRIVGRDPQTLDEAGVARAAIESLAENASDGVVAPAFWFLLLGLPGLVAYKAINTADSMIGHRTPRHEAFGWAAACLDDIVNLPASRLTGMLFAAAALATSRVSAANALRTMLRDAPKHRSPNAGWPESAMAGALGLKLNGPKNYGGSLVDDAYMGDGRREATAKDIHNALSLAVTAWMMMVAALLVIAVILRT